MQSTSKHRDSKDDPSMSQKANKDGDDAEAGDSSSKNHNALTESEDDASKARREKARSSLGLGGGK